MHIGARHHREVEQCVSAAGTSGPRRFLVRFVVSPAGAPTVTIWPSGHSGDALITCVKDAAQRWVFPPRPSSSIVTYALRLVR